MFIIHITNIFTRNLSLTTLRDFKLVRLILRVNLFTTHSNSYKLLRKNINTFEIIISLVIDVIVNN